MCRPTTTDQDFYCSFTHLPEAANVDELPYTIHTAHSITHPTIFSRRSRQLPAPSPYPRVMSSTSTSSKSSSFWSTLSVSSSLRRRRLLAGLRRMLRGISKRRRGARRSTSGGQRRGWLDLTRKPSTLDFRCVGWEDGEAGCFGARRSGLWGVRMDEGDDGGEC